MSNPKETVRSQVFRIMMEAGYTPQFIANMLNQFELELAIEFHEAEAQSIKAKLLGTMITEPEQVEREPEHGC